ncbi:MAG: hypothetical protein WC307_06575 [Candidatus Nanoarchaeia archaeon]|jgi:hypothetical protein
MELLLTTIYAMIGSAITAAGFYLKNTNYESFDKVKFAKTVILSALCTIGACVLGVSDNEFATSAIGVFLANLIEPFIKSIFREDSKLRTLLRLK